ncbi:YjdJ family protein [Bacillus sp. KH172YL63]|uniref:YjdJ family protein n=1 Tax=Bacillus sp. KH172YL63 TaxID=2709784 RepID=UPI0013E521F6|nr:YjdJ family protein [Bacillus sp. KH172YL63]BCB03953.1 hypothetical protein KH172YL63_20860 [Bacillus sp. KH172YL63]
MKYIIQYGTALIILAISSFSAWYEGSAIRDYPSEWKYTALYSKMMHGDVTTPGDISQLDHFIYAAKFHPFFPIFMALSMSYLLLISGVKYLKHRPNMRMSFFLILAAIHLLLFQLVSASPTAGGQTFTITFMILGMVHLLLAFMIYIRSKKEDRLEEDPILTK